MESPTYLYPSLLLILLFLGASSLLFFFFSSAVKKKKCTTSSNSSSSFSLTELMKNRHRMLDWSAEVLSVAPNHTLTLNFGARAVLTANPSNIEHVLKTNFNNYHKGPTVIANFQDLLGHGILNSDGDHWQLQRKLVVQQFTARSFRTSAMDVVLSGVVNRLLPLLSSSSTTTTTTVLDLQDVFDRFGFDNFCQIAFGVDTGRLTRKQHDKEEDDYEAVLNSLDSASRLVTAYRPPRLLRLLASLFGRSGADTRLKAELAILDGFITKVIRERKKTIAGHNYNNNNNVAAAVGGTDLLSRFLAAGPDLPDDLLRDMMVNLMGAGRDTTSSAMSWFFWLVSSKPEVGEKIREEIRSVREKHGSTGKAAALTVEEVRDMNYLHAAVSESLRLYPSVPVDARVAIERDVLPDGTEVRKGMSVMHSPYVMGRMESIWGEDCKEFVPERWLADDDDDENGLMFVPKNPYQYPVFHAGPRMCVGKEMAYYQIKGVVASVMEKFKVEMAEEGEREQENVFALRMKKGLPVLITPL